MVKKWDWYPWRQGAALRENKADRLKSNSFMTQVPRLNLTRLACISRHLKNRYEGSLHSKIESEIDLVNSEWKRGTRGWLATTSGGDRETSQCVEAIDFVYFKHWSHRPYVECGEFSHCVCRKICVLENFFAHNLLIAVQKINIMSYQLHTVSKSSCHIIVYHK